MSILVKLISVLLILFLFSCSNKKTLNFSGITNLEEKSKFIKLNETNKNDILRNFGSSLLIDNTNEELWFYFESINTKNMFGQNKNLKNDILIVSFDKKGIVSRKKILTIKDINNEINFDDQITETFAINKSISNRISSIVKKRIDKKNK